MENKKAFKVLVLFSVFVSIIVFIYRNPWLLTLYYIIIFFAAMLTSNQDTLKIYGIFCLEFLILTLIFPPHIDFTSGENKQLIPIGIFMLALIITKIFLQKILKLKNFKQA